MQRQAQHCGTEFVDDVGGGCFEERHVRPRDAHADHLVEVAHVVPEQQLNQQRHGAEDPDIEPRDGGQQSRTGHPHECQEEPEHEPTHGRNRGEQQGVSKCADHGFRGEPFGHHTPLPAGIGEQGPHDAEQHQATRAVPTQRQGFRAGTTVKASGRCGGAAGGPECSVPAGAAVDDGVTRYSWTVTGGSHRSTRQRHSP